MWQSYENFASTTELHGFDMILRYKDNKFWAAVWICLTAVAVCMCANDVVNLAILYQSEPTAVSVSAKENLNLPLPNPTLCMEIHVDRPMIIEALQFAYKQQSSKRYTYLTTAKIQSKIDQDIIPFLTATSNAENLDFSTYEQLQLSGYLEYYTYMMLSYITEAELTYIGYNNTVLMNCETILVQQMPDGDRRTINVNATIGYLYHLYKSKNVSIENLKRLVGMSVCQKRTASFTGKKNGVSMALPLCKPRMITHLSFSRGCAKLFEDDSHKLADYDSFTINGTKIVEIPYPGSDVGIYPTTFLTSKVRFTWYLDFEGRNILPINNRQGIFGWNPTLAAALQVSIAAEYQLYNAQLRPCSDAELSSTCEWRQRVSKLQYSCGCQPATLFYDSSETSLPQCGLNNPMWNLQYDTANSGIVSEANFTGFCDKDVPDFGDIVCMRNCRVLGIKVEPRSPSMMIRTGVWDALSEGSFQSILGLIEFSLKVVGDHTYYEETPSKDFNTFVCDFGGSIGAWLGASLMAFVHAAIHIFLTCRDVRNRLIDKVDEMHENAG